MNRLAGANGPINILRGKINLWNIYFPCSLFMSLCQIYSCSLALSLLPPSLGSRASKYHFWVVHRGCRWQKCGHTCLLSASWASGVIQGLRWPKTQETWPPAPHLHMYDVGPVVWSPCPSCSPFTKSKVMTYSSGLVFENELVCVRAKWKVLLRWERQPGPWSSRIWLQRLPASKPAWVPLLPWALVSLFVRLES